MSGDKETKVLVEFRVMGFSRKPQDVLKDLKITAYESAWEKGMPRSKGIRLLHDENGFSIAADKRFKTVEERVAKLIEKVYPLKKRLQQVCGSYSAELSCVIYTAGEDIPAFHLSQDVLEQLADLKAEIDIDLYFISE